MSCCGKPELIVVNAKCSDMCHIRYPDLTEEQGYVPRNINIGGGDYIEFSYCINCGKIRGKFPIMAEIKTTIKPTIEKIDDDHWKVDETNIRYVNDFGYPGWYIEEQTHLGGGMSFQEAIEKVMNTSKSKKKVMPEGVG